MAAYEFADEEQASAYVATFIQKSSHSDESEFYSADISDLIDTPAAADELQASIWEIIDWYVTDDQGNYIEKPNGVGSRGVAFVGRAGTVVYEYTTVVGEPVYIDEYQESRVEPGGPGVGVLQGIVDYTFSRVR
jgi:hypothetical protein